MFEGGVPEQLRRFIASPPPPPPPLPHPPPAPTAARALPFPLSFPPFESTHHFLNPVLLNTSHKIIDHHHHDEIKDVDASGWVGPTDHHSCRPDHDDNCGDDTHHHHHHPWSSDEVLALLRLRSTMENWFPEFTWEHISRRLTEIGFKRTPQECKEKFEEEERKYFNNNSNNNINNYNNNNNNKGNYRMFSELEELYHHGQHHHDHHDDEHVSSKVGHNESKKQKPLDQEPRSQENDKIGQDLEEDPRKKGGEVGINPSDEGKSGNTKNDGRSSSPTTLSSSSSPQQPSREMMLTVRSKKKRKRERFEMLKGFCEGFVRNMIAQQEEMHKKLLEDMVKRDEEKIAREEAWKRQELERINKELEIRAHEQALASDRNATIIKFITNFTPLSEDHHHHHHHQHHRQGNKVHSPSTSQSSSSLVLPQNPSNKIPNFTIESPSSGPKQAPTSSSSQTLTPQNRCSLPTHDKSSEPISVPTLKTKTQNPKPSNNDEKDDLGKRWPRDEVLALINIRCSISTSNGDHHNHQDHHHHKDGSSSSKVLPLWERISKKMLALGYKRSAKRCKEKWENINKYFRKTKDVNKKRPLDSRTCPYFHQLSTLYNQGSLGTAPATAATTTKVVAPATGEGASGDLGTRPDETQAGSLKDGSGGDPTRHVSDGGDEKKMAQVPGFDFEFQ